MEKRSDGVEGPEAAEVLYVALVALGVIPFGRWEDLSSVAKQKYRDIASMVAYRFYH